MDFIFSFLFLCLLPHDFANLVSTSLMDAYTSFTCTVSPVFTPLFSRALITCVLVGRARGERQRLERLELD